MSERLSLELPDTVMRSARAVASQTNRQIEAVVIEWLERATTTIPVDQLPDDQVLALRDQQMSEAEQHELSDLLEQQREGALTSTGRQRLNALLHTYRIGMVRKAQALNVAVERGLQPPLQN